jgi:hypothetical protein
MMIGIQLMFFHLIGIQGANGALRELLAYTRIYLAHLRSLLDLVAQLLQRLSRLDGAEPCRCPDSQGP